MGLADRPRWVTVIPDRLVRPVPETTLHRRKWVGGHGHFNGGPSRSRPVPDRLFTPTHSAAIDLHGRGRHRANGLLHVGHHRYDLGIVQPNVQTVRARLRRLRRCGQRDL